MTNKYHKNKQKFIENNINENELTAFLKTLTKHDFDLLNSKLKSDFYLSEISFNGRLEYLQGEFEKVFSKESKPEWSEFKTLSINEKITLKAFKNSINKRNKDSIFYRTGKMFNKSNDFKKAMLILLEDEERYFNEIEENINNIEDNDDDHIETSLSNFIVFEEGLMEKLENIALNASTNILQRFEEDFKEIELLQGTQRELRVIEFKKELFEQIIKTNSLYILSKHYAPVYEKEMAKFLSIC